MSLRTEERAPDALELREIVFLFDSGPGSFTPTVRLQADSEGYVCLDKDKASMVGRRLLTAARDGWGVRLMADGEGRVHLDTEEASKLGRLFLAAAQDGWDLRVLPERLPAP